MRREELERRAAEMKARMLADRGGPGEKSSATPVRKSRPKGGQKDSQVIVESLDVDVPALRRRVKELEAENLRLRQQVASLANRTAPAQPSADSVREQRHNFFKYSNARRY